MSNSENNPATPVQDNEVVLDELKAKATTLGIKYSPNIGYDKLKEKVEDKLGSSNATTKPTEDVATKDDVPNSTASEFQDTVNKGDVSILPVRVRISNLDANEREFQTTYKCVLNSGMSIAKVVPLDKEWYVPLCICQAMEDDMMQVHVHETDPKTGKRTGNMIPKQVKKYNVQYL